MGQRVLLTGGGGFSGVVYAERFAAAGAILTVHAGRSRGRLPPDFESRSGATVVLGDLAEVEADGPLAGPFDIVVHAGAMSAAPGVSADTMIRANALGTERVAALAQATGARAVIYFSSLSVYGAIYGPFVNEATPFIRPDVYGASKYLGELALASRGGAFASISIRLPGVLGPHSVRNFLTGVRAKAATGQPIQYFGPATEFNNAVHIDDLADFALALFDQDLTGHDAIVVGATGRMTIDEIVRLIAAEAGGGSALAPESAGNKPSFLIDDARARDRYAYSPRDIEAVIRCFAREDV